MPSFTEQLRKAENSSMLRNKVRISPTLMTLFLAFVCLLGSGTSRAQDGDLTITLEAPERLAVGDRGEVRVTVTAPHSSGQPMIVTPTSEGQAVEVVRGRLLRSDGVAEGESLRFRVPIVAVSAGASVFRVRVMTYVCTSRCRAVTADAFVVLHPAAR